MTLVFEDDHVIIILVSTIYRRKLRNVIRQSKQIIVAFCVQFLILNTRGDFNEKTA